MYFGAEPPYRLPMNGNRNLVALAFATMLVVFGTMSAAYAGVTWSTGYQIAGPTPKHDAFTVANWEASGCPSRERGSDAGAGMVRMSGDKLWAMDTCKDGYSVFAEWKDRKTGAIYRCRNNRGFRSVVECNFDWPERSGFFLIGISKGETVKYRDVGTMYMLTTDGQSCRPSTTSC